MAPCLCTTTLPSVLLLVRAMKKPSTCIIGDADRTFSVSTDSCWSAAGTAHKTRIQNKFLRMLKPPPKTNKKKNNNLTIRYHHILWLHPAQLWHYCTDKICPQTERHACQATQRPLCGSFCSLITYTQSHKVKNNTSRVYWLVKLTKSREILFSLMFYVGLDSSLFACWNQRHIFLFFHLKMSTRATQVQFYKSLYIFNALN